jgi:hypothetical protein
VQNNGLGVTQLRILKNVKQAVSLFSNFDKWRGDETLKQANSLFDVQLRNS